MTSTQPPKALILSGVDQEQLQREFARAFPQSTELSILEEALMKAGVNPGFIEAVIDIEKTVMRML